MKLPKFKSSLALMLAFIGMHVASRASLMCPNHFCFEEPKMPESLYKRD